MKTPRILVALALASASLSQSAHAAVLVGWDSWNNNVGDNLGANKTTSGFTATIVANASQVNTSFGSSDSTFGSNVTGATGGGPALLVRENNGSSFTLSLTNNTGFNYTLETLNFDFAARSGSDGAGYNAFTVTYNSGGLGPASTQVAAESGLAYTTSGGTGIADHPDFDYNLGDTLTDLVLANGESALFTFQFSGKTGTNGNGISSIIDNIAITGTAVPEPSALLLSALGLLPFLRRKR